MDPNVITLTLFALLGAGCGLPVAWLASRRSAAQPVPVDSASERRLLAAVAATPARVEEAFEATKLEGRHFAHPARSAVWDAIVAAHRDDPESDPSSVIAAARALLDGDAAAIAQLDQAVDLAVGVDAHGDGELRDDDASLVVLDAEDREAYPGSAPLERTGGEDPLARVFQPPTTRRFAVAAFACGAGFALSAWLGGPKGVWSVAALCSVALLGYFIAAVDHDTLYLDNLGFWSGSLVAWGLAVAACVSEGRPWALAVGAVAAVAWAVGFELLNLAYKLLRGTYGQGMGDTFIVLTCTGVPGAISGDLMVGVTSVLAGSVLAVAVSIPKMVRGERGMRTAFALGPFLAVGWAAAWVVLHLAGYFEAVA